MASFVAICCEDGYRNAKHLGRQAGQIAKQYVVPSLRPTKKDAGWHLFLLRKNERDLKPKRAKSVKKKLPVASFLAFCCADGYRNAKHLGRQAGQIAKQ